MTILRQIMIGLAAFLATPALAGDPLTIAVWGGAVAEGQAKAFIEPFRKQGGAVVLADLQSGANGSAAQWDVIESDGATIAGACLEGVVDKIDWKRLGLDQGKFIGAGQQPCAVPAMVYATVLVYDKSKLSTGPTKIADLFDLQKFPGKRALRKTAMVNLEWALIADGVAQADVYKALRTKAGADRAFKKLESIKKQIVWWSDGAEPEKLLSGGDVVMASAFNGRANDAVKARGRPFSVVWDNQALDWVWWAVAKQSPRKEAAYNFIAFVSGPERGADQARFGAYGPANKDSLPLIGKSDLDSLPTAPDNMKSALFIDAKFWSGDGAALKQRFADWAAK